MNLRLALVVVLAARGGGGLVLRRREDLLLLSLKVPHLMDDQPGLMYQQSQSTFHHLHLHHITRDVHLLCFLNLLSKFCNAKSADF